MLDSLHEMLWRNSPILDIKYSENCSQSVASSFFAWQAVLVFNRILIDIDNWFINIDNSIIDIDKWFTDIDKSIINIEKRRRIIDNSIYRYQNLFIDIDKSNYR